MRYVSIEWVFNIYYREALIRYYKMWTIIVTNSNTGDDCILLIDLRFFISSKITLSYPPPLSFSSIEKLSGRDNTHIHARYGQDSFKVSAKWCGCQRCFDIGQVLPVLTSLVNWQRFFSLRICQWNFRAKNIVRSFLTETFLKILHSWYEKTRKNHK